MKVSYPIGKLSETKLLHHRNRLPHFVQKKKQKTWNIIQRINYAVLGINFY